MAKINDASFPVLNRRAAERMESAILNASNDLDSVGGILETVVTGMPAGVGEPFFDSLESRLSHALFSIPAVKGVCFGLGFGFASLRGSAANDPIVLKEVKIVSQTNNNGGINGGISNGMPILFSTCIKPTPSIYQKQKSVSWSDKTQVELEIKGRHDPAIIHRARAVVDAMTSFVLLDALMERQGTEYFQKEFAQ
jgi:chorismate synthase